MTADKEVAMLLVYYVWLVVLSLAYLGFVYGFGS